MNLQVFDSSEFGEIGVLIEDEKQLFSASDCARALGYTNPHKAVQDHCKNVVSRRTNDSLGRAQKINFIFESDLYRLIVRSKLPSAEKFERWVFEEVLPSIRRTGAYTKNMSVAQMLNQQLAIVINGVDELDSRVGNLENNMTVDFGQQNRLQSRGRQTAVEVLGGKDSPAYRDRSIRGKVFSAMWRDYKDYFAVASYRDTARVDIDRALDYLADWRPQGALKREVELIGGIRYDKTS